MDEFAKDWKAINEGRYKDISQNTHLRLESFCTNQMRVDFTCPLRGRGNLGKPGFDYDFIFYPGPGVSFTYTFQ